MKFPPLRGRTVLERLLEKCVQEPDGCWTWVGAKQKGYGAIAIDGRTQRAYRVLYELQIGQIPEGLELDHLCRNIRCINPAHLEPVTHQENMRRAALVKDQGGYQRAKEWCANGHMYDEVNTYRDSRGHRACRACKREWARINTLGWARRNARDHR